MKIIFTYNRPDSLQRLLDEFKGHDILVIDDGSDESIESDHAEVIRTLHKGKEGFWENWNIALDICRESDHEYFYFLQDDVIDIDMDGINSVCNSFDFPFAFNIPNYGMSQCWTSLKNRKVKVHDYVCYQTGYVDCIFFCNRGSLDKIEWELYEIDPDRFQKPNISSGVGKQLSQRFLKEGVMMFKPLTSLCKQQESAFNSLMNPEERKINQRRMI